MAKPRCVTPDRELLRRDRIHDSDGDSEIVGVNVQLSHSNHRYGNVLPLVAVGEPLLFVRRSISGSWNPAESGAPGEQCEVNISHSPSLLKD